MSGSLYVSDTNSRRIYRVKSLSGAKDLAGNSEVVAGTGEQCLPFDEARCGDGGKAVDATLMSPRGKGYQGRNPLPQNKLATSLAFFVDGNERTPGSPNYSFPYSNFTLIGCFGVWVFKKKKKCLSEVNFITHIGYKWKVGLIAPGDF